MNKEEIIKSLNKVYENSQDTHNIYTPLELCEEMINSLSDLNGDKSILVISNLEFLIVLKSKINLENVHYTTRCDIKKQVAINLGLNVNNIYNLEYNKEINLGIKEKMKFDIIIQNPPYNPNRLWKKFVLKGIDLLNEDGKMVAIHPSDWRDSSKHDKLYQHLKEHISELHINDYEIWKELKVGIKTDRYLYNKNKQNQCQITYSNGVTEFLNLKNVDRILRICTKTTPYSILNKILSDKDNGLILDNGYNYIKHIDNGKYKQCGGVGNGTGWTNNDFVLTNEPTTYQFNSKVVISYSNKPRARYFHSSDEVGIGRAFFWLTENRSIVILINSKLFWKIAECVAGNPNWFKTFHPRQLPIWIYRYLNFDNLNVQNEEELYAHYNLTQEEINWIENE